MKVFINHPIRGRVGGLIVVAAASASEAHRILCAQGEWLAYWYGQDRWEELTGVTSDAETPRILAHG